MSLKKNAFGTSGLNIILAVAGLVIITTSLATPTGAQQAGLPTAEEPEMEIEDLFILPGAQLAAGADKQASGPLQIQSYKLEEVMLPRPLKLGDTKVVKSVLRLTVTLGFEVHGNFTIFVDDEPKEAVITQRNGVSAIFFSPSELEDGAQISVARGAGCNTHMSSTMKRKLQLPEDRRRPQRGDADPGYGVKKIRSLPARQGSRDRNEVEIQLTTPVPFAVSNEVLVMQVGGLEVMGGGYGYGDKTLIFRMSADEFSRAEDGKRIKVKYGLCSGGGTRFGRLNKAQLDQ